MPIRVLVVEDEPLIQMAITMALEDAGFRVATAETAEGAEQIDKIDPQDFVLLDVNLGRDRRTGIDAAKTIRARRQGVPIAFLTAHADDHMKRLMSVVDPVKIMSKPFNDSAVVNLIAETMATKKAR